MLTVPPINSNPLSCPLNFILFNLPKKVKLVKTFPKVAVNAFSKRETVSSLELILSFIRTSCVFIFTEKISSIIACEIVL